MQKNPAPNNVKFQVLASLCTELCLPKRYIEVLTPKPMNVTLLRNSLCR